MAKPTDPTIKIHLSNGTTLTALWGEPAPEQTENEQIASAWDAINRGLDQYGDRHTDLAGTRPPFAQIGLEDGGVLSVKPEHVIAITAYQP